MEEEGKGGVKGEVGDKGKGLTDAYVCYPGTSMPCTFLFCHQHVSEADECYHGVSGQ